MPKSVFISYSVADIDTVTRIKKQIESENHKIWLYPTAIEPGDHIVESERKGIEELKQIIICEEINSSSDL